MGEDRNGLVRALLKEFLKSRDGVGSDGYQTRYQAGTYDGMWNEWTVKQSI